MDFARSFERVLVTSALAVLVAACGGKSLSNDDLTAPSDPTDPTDPTNPGKDAGPDGPVVCNGPNLACDSGDQAVGSEAGCGNADYCYSRTGCAGSLLWCAHYGKVQCGAVPRCDQGDEEAPCPGGLKGVTCYSRTACGSTIQCVHTDKCSALPSCNPGDTEVTDITTCSMKGIDCYEVTACNFAIHCYTP
jgi:hypothetical protein